MLHGLAERLVNTQATETSIDYPNISDQDAKTIAHAIATNNILAKFSLSWQEISDTGATKLIEGLRCNTSLTSINLSWAWQKNKNRRSISITISGNNAGGRSADALEETLNINRRLEQHSQKHGANPHLLNASSTSSLEESDAEYTTSTEENSSTSLSPR